MNERAGIGHLDPGAVAFGLGRAQHFLQGDDIIAVRRQILFIGPQQGVDQRFAARGTVFARPDRGISVRAIKGGDSVVGRGFGRDDLRKWRWKTLRLPHPSPQTKRRNTGHQNARRFHPIKHHCSALTRIFIHSPNNLTRILTPCPFTTTRERARR